MTSYCTTLEIGALTETTLDATTLQEIIEEGDVEINAYLKARGTTGTACDELNAASKKLANAGMILRNPLGSESTAVTTAVNILRKSAFELLDNYLATMNTTRSRPRVSRVRAI